MKAKNLLLALAVPTAFAACSQEEFESDVQKVNDGRPVVGTIVLDIPENAQTRWGWSGGIAFDDSDYMGAALMDQVNNLSSGTPWNTKYTIVDYISTNYKYGYKDNWTNGDAVMSEGNYFFYLPYNEKLKSRAGLTYSIPEDQFAYDETAENPVAEEKRSWEKNQMLIGYDDVLEGDQAAKPQLVELFAKPRFNVNYVGSGDTKVERIVLKDATGRFDVKGKLKPTGVLAGTYNPVKNATGDVSKYNVAIGSNLVQAFMAYNKAVTEYTLKTGEEFLSPFAAENVFVDVKPADQVAAISLNFVPKAAVTGLMVVPAGTHNAAGDVSQIGFDIYTNKGIVSFNSNTTGALATAADGTDLTYKNIDKLATIKAGAGVKADAVTINFGDKDVKIPTNVTVSTTAQLESIMRWYTNPASTETALTSASGKLTVNILTGSEVELTKKVYDIIKANDKLTVVFNGTITIASDLASDAIMLVDAGSAAEVIVTNTQALSYTKDVTLSYDVEIKEGATLNVTTGEKTTKLADVTNKGTLNFVSGKAEATKIDNEGELNVNAEASVTAVLNNLAIAETNQSTGFTTYTAAAVVTNNGYITAVGGKNEATINNNAKINVTAPFSNDRKAAKRNVTNGFNGVINNENASNSYIYANAALTNGSNIYNKGAIYSQGSGTITNGRYIMAYDGATTYVTDNNGEIELEKRTTETQVNGIQGTISYTMTANDLTNGAFAKTNEDKFNTLKVSMDVSFAHKNVAPESLILSGRNLTVTCNEVVANPSLSIDAIGTAEFKKITAESGYRYNIKGNKVKADVVVVKSGAVLQIPAGSTFGILPATAPTSLSGVNGLLDNSGEILVGGKFFGRFGGIVPTGSGKYSSAGTGSYEWNSKTDFEAEDAAVNVLTNSTTIAASTTYVVNSDVTIAGTAFDKASVTLIGGHTVTITGTTITTGFIVGSKDVKIVLGSAASPFKTGTSGFDKTMFNSSITTSKADVKVGVYYNDSGSDKTYYVEYKWVAGTTNDWNEVDESRKEIV